MTTTVTRRNVLGFTLGDDLIFRSNYTSKDGLAVRSVLSFGLGGFSFRESYDEYIVSKVLYKCVLPKDEVELPEEPYSNLSFPLAIDDELEVSAYLNEILFPCNETDVYTLSYSGEVYANLEFPLDMPLEISAYTSGLLFPVVIE